MMVDQYSFILEWPFITEKMISFVDLSRHEPEHIIISPKIGTPIDG